MKMKAKLYSSIWFALGDAYRILEFRLLSHYFLARLRNNMNINSIIFKGAFSPLFFSVIDIGSYKDPCLCPYVCGHYDTGFHNI